MIEINFAALVILFALTYEEAKQLFFRTKVVVHYE
jgi:hypothetical protein